MGDVAIPAGDSRLRGCLAIPDGEGPWPGVVVVHDVRGMTVDLRRITDRFAASGYLAIAPWLEDRPGRRTNHVTSTFGRLLAGHGLAYGNLLAAREYLISAGQCSGHVGLAGFYTGAGVCLQLAPGFVNAPDGTGKGRESPSAAMNFGVIDPVAARASFMNRHPLPAPMRLVAGTAGIADSAPEAEGAWQRIIAFFAEHLTAV